MSANIDQWLTLDTKFNANEWSQNIYENWIILFGIHVHDMCSESKIGDTPRNEDKYKEGNGI